MTTPLIPPTAEGDGVRLALRHLPPSLADDHAVRDFLARFAHDLDRSAAKRRAETIARDNRAALTRTANSWVRRTQGNGGPGVPGAGHVAHPWKTATYTDRHAIALCGKTLIGSLHWHAGPPATADNRRPPTGWTACRDCVRDLRTTIRTPA